MSHRALLLMLAIGVTTPALAHDVMGTVIFVDLGRARAHLDVEVPLDQLRLAWGLEARPGVVDPPGSPEEMLAYVRDHLRVLDASALPFTLELRAEETAVHDDRNWMRVSITATPPEGSSARDFVIDTDLVDHRVLSHRIFVFLRRDLGAGQLGGSPELLKVLHYQEHRAQVQGVDPSFRAAGWAAFRLGLGHIAEGSDHLLFLFTLLLPAGLVARRGWAERRSTRASAREALRVVTAFTVGHSLTLLLGATALVRLPTALVESLIAASIVASAAHALWPLFPRRENWVALLFGLVHGLGFASALEGLGVDGATLAITVLGFNLGVEVMQVGMVLVTLPSMLALQDTRTGTLARVAGAAGALVVSSAWMAERAWQVHTPVPALAERLFSVGPWLIVALAAAALFAKARERVRVMPVPATAQRREFSA